MEEKTKIVTKETTICKRCGDIFIIQDADLEYNPQDYHGLIRPILTKKSDVVYGSRFKARIRIYLSLL